MRTYPHLVSATAKIHLCEAGIDVPDGDPEIELRDERWMVHLPGGMMAIFAATDAGAERIRREGELLRLLERHVSFRAPRVVTPISQTSCEVRRKVEGMVGFWSVFRRALDDSGLSRRIGHSIAELLAELHSALPLDTVRELLPIRTSWPPHSNWIREHIPQVTNDRTLIDKIDALLEIYGALDITDCDRVPVHGDVGLHNLVFQPDTLEVAGIFDFDSAAFTDRHFDLRYLELHPEQPAMLEAAIATYETNTGRTLSRQRILLHNAASAVGFLAYRVGHAPDERWCGRTLKRRRCRQRSFQKRGRGR